jgi:uncharacterized protein YbdZ (MbtH family)
MDPSRFVYRADIPSLTAFAFRVWEKMVPLDFRAKVWLVSDNAQYSLWQIIFASL